MMDFFALPGMSTIITLVFNFVMAVAVIAMKATWTPRKDHDALKERVDHLETRHKSLAEKINDMPDQKVFYQLTVQLTALNGRLDVFDANVNGISEDFKRLERHLNLIDKYQREAAQK